MENLVGSAIFLWPRIYAISPARRLIITTAFKLRGHRFSTMIVSSSSSTIFGRLNCRRGIRFSSRIRLTAQICPSRHLRGSLNSDLYVDSLIHFPARWHDQNFSGVVPKGTPVAQCIAFKRENWVEQFDVLSEQATQRLLATAGAIAEETGVYRRAFRVPKR